MADLTISVSIDAKNTKSGADETKRAVRGIADEAEKAAKKTSSLAKVDYSGAIKQLKEYGDKIKNVGSQISGVGQTLSLAITAPIVGLTTLAFGFTAMKQRAELSFKVLLRDGEKAKVLMKDLTEFADKTPFESQEIIDSGRKLVAFGVDATQVKSILTDLGDTAAAMEVNIVDVANAFGRLKAGDFGEAFERFRDFGISRESLEAKGLKFDKSGQYLGSVEQAMEAVRGVMKEKFGGTMDELSNSISGKFSTVIDKAKGLLIKLFEPAQPVLSQQLDNLVTVIQRVMDYFDQASPQVRLFILVILSIAAAVGPVLVVFGTLITFVGSVVGAIGTLIPIFAAVGGAFAAFGGFIVSFIGLIGQAGLVASFSALATVLGGTVSAAIGTFLSALAPIAVGVAAVAAVIGVLIGIGVALYAAWQSNFGGLRDFTTEVFNQISNAIGTALAFIQQTWATYGTQIITTATDTFNSIVEFVRPIMTEIVAFMREAWQTIVEVAGPLLTQLVGIVKTHLTAMMLVVSVILASISAFWTQHSEQIKSIVSAIWTILKTIVLAGIRQIANVITLVLAVINGDWAAAWNALKSIVQTGVNASITILKSFGTLIISALAFVATKLYNIGRDIIQGLVNGISSGASAVYETAANIASGVISKFKSVFATQSPSRITTEIGAFVSEGLAAGIESKESRVVSAAKKVAGAAIKQFQDAQKEFSKLAGASPETQRTIQQANQTTDAASGQQEIIKLRGELGVNNDLALPSDVAGTIAELKYLQEKKKLLEETVPPYQQLEEIGNSIYETRAKEIENFNKVKDSIETSGANELLQAQKEFDLLGVTDDLEKQRIENAYELIKLRQQLSSDGYGEGQIQEALELQRIEQARVLEWLRLKQIKQQQIDLDKKVNDEQLKAAEESKKKFEDSANQLAGSLSRIFNAGISGGFKGFLKQTFEELKNFGTKLLNDVLNQLAQGLSRFILGKLGGSGGFLGKLFGGGSSGSGGSSSGGGFNLGSLLGGLFGNRSGSSSGGNQLVNTLLSEGSNAPGAPGSPGGSGGGISLAGGLSLAGAGLGILGSFFDNRAGRTISGIGQGLSMGATIGSIVPGIGTVIGAGIGALIGGLAGLFGGDPKRKKDKKENLPALNKGFADALEQLRALGADKNSFYQNPEATIAKAIELRAQIASGFGIKFESKKYQKQAQQQIAAKLVEADGIIANLNKLKDRAVRAREVDSQLQTSFATGVYIRDDQMRDMQRSLDYKRRNGMLSGAFTGTDVLPSMLARGEMVLNPSQISQVILNAGDDPFKNAGIPGYNTGAYLAPSAPSPSSLAATSTSNSSQVVFQPNIKVVIEGEGISNVKIKEILVDNLKKDDVQVELVKAYDKGKTRV